MKYRTKRTRRAGMMSMVLVLVILFLLFSVATVTIMATASRVQSYTAHQSEDLFAVDSVINILKAEGPDYIRAATTSGMDVTTFWNTAFARIIPSDLKQYITDEKLISRQDFCTMDDGTGYAGLIYICTISFEGESISETYNLVFAGQDYQDIRMGDFLGYA